jgi:SAM-dependent methyltransferase
MSSSWEDNISINSSLDKEFQVLGPASNHLGNTAATQRWPDLDFEDALRKDTFPLPLTEDREGYFGDDHFSYWASGLFDAQHLMNAAESAGTIVRSYFDLGCASGRVTRHFATCWPNVRTIGCDINRSHVLWCNEYLPKNCLTFQGHSIPTLPLPDNSVDLVSAYSVFTHIETFETTWLMELRRIMSPGAVAWITVHTELTLAAMDESWPLWSPVMDHPDLSEQARTERTFLGDRLVLRWLSDKSYSSNVFYKRSYIEGMLSRLFEVIEFRNAFPEYQDVFIVRKLA